jgi:hypothetical protein
MQLGVTFMEHGNYAEAFANLEVESDDAGQHGEYFRRLVTAKIQDTSPNWQSCVESLKQAQHAEVEGHSYARTGVQVDHDFHSLIGGFINVDGKTVRLVLLERFEGSRDEYYAMVKERNEQVQDYLDGWNDGRVTRNDLRNLMGLIRMDDPHLDQPIEPNAIAQARTTHLPKAASLGLSRNNVI